MTETKPTDGREVVRCWIRTDNDDDTFVVTVNPTPDDTPAVAVPEAVYNEVRRELANALSMIENAPGDSEGAAIYHEDDIAPIRKALALLPEIPQ